MVRAFIWVAAAVAGVFGVARAQTVRFSPQAPMPLGIAAPLSKTMTPAFAAPALISVLPGARPIFIPGVKSPQAAAMAVAKMTERFDAINRASPDIQKVSAERAGQVGEKSFAALSGVEPESARYWGKPAGEEIGESAAAHFAEHEENPEPSLPVMSAPVSSRSNRVVGWIKKAGAAVGGFVSRRNPFKK